MIATVNNCTPKTIEAATIILGKSSCASGRPKILPAMWSPIVLPGKLAGNSPKKEKMMILTLAPIYIVA
jgi:hypothetical protein